MAIRLYEAHASEDGQSLPLILVVVLIGAIIAFSIAARTVQDIRRTARERTSDQAGTQVETYLDGISSTEILSRFIDENFEFTSECTVFEGVGNEICVLTSAQMAEIFGDLECDEGTLKLRKITGVSSVSVGQDESFQIDLIGLTGPSSFDLSWTGANHLLITVYGMDPVNNEIFLYEEDFVSPLAWTSTSAYVEDDAWGFPTPVDTYHSVPYPANPLFARIHPVGGDAVLNAMGIPDQQVAAKATCNIDNIYREFVRIIPAYESLPAVFDYVLYDRTTQINEF